MNSTTEKIFKLHIESLKGTNFQLFIEKLYTICYEGNFTRILQKRDKGCDGILNGRTVMAVYAPEKHSLDSFKRKIKNETPGKEGDFDKYTKYWQKDYPGWQIVYNGEFTAEMAQFARSLKRDAELLGLQHLLELINRQYWGHIRVLADYLDIEQEYIVKDIFDQIVRDLLKECKPASPPKYLSPLYIKEKIPLNFTGEDIEKMKDEYHDSLKYFHNLQTILKPYGENNDDLSALKNKVRMDIEKYPGKFKKKLHHLTEQYSEKSKHDDLYKLFVRVFIIYLFEQCILGKKTGREKKNDLSTS